MKKGNELLLQENNFKEKISGVILCAGEGKRLKTITKNTPKSLIKIERLENISILHHSINNLINLKIKQIGVVIGYLGDSIREFILSLEKKNQTIQDKVIIIDTENQYKFGPLYSLLSIIKNKDFFTSTNYFLVIPGDTIFNYNLLKEVLSIISNNFDLIQMHPFVFYRIIGLKPIKELYSINRIISNAEIENIGSKTILKKITQGKIKNLLLKNVINQIIPVTLFNYDFINEMLNLKGKIPYKTVWESMNYMINNGKKIYAFKIKSQHQFYDIDNINDLKSSKKEDNRCSD